MHKSFCIISIRQVQRIAHETITMQTPTIIPASSGAVAGSDQMHSGNPGSGMSGMSTHALVAHDKMAAAGISAHLGGLGAVGSHELSCTPVGVDMQSMQMATQAHIANMAQTFVPRASIVIDPREEWMRSGDWICENCNDVQFKKNFHCRCCGNPSPFLLCALYGVAPVFNTVHGQPVQHMNPIAMQMEF